MVVEDHENTISSKLTGQLAPSAQDKNERAQRNMLKKKKEARIKRAISKTFVFNREWKRQDFTAKLPPDTQIESFYQAGTFENQRLFGSQICGAFDDLNVTHILAIAPTQSGKTGSMLALIREFNKHDAKHRVDVNHVFIFTGHSSTEWTIQTKERFPKHMENQIFHRNQLKTFLNAVKDLNNVLIIFDESHIANKYGQTLYSLYNKLGFFNIKRLYSKNIKIVHFTATPDSLIHNIDRWQESLKIIHMQVPTNYVSVDHYRHNKQFFQCKPLLGQYDNIRQLANIIDINDPFYHIIRTHRGHKHLQLIRDFQNVFKYFDFKFISEPFYRNNNNFLNLLSHKPISHTFIFIIDKLRCAKSIPIQHIQICYERFVHAPHHDSVLQGLLGRCTGFHNFTSHIRIFTFDTSHSHTTHTHIFNPF